MFTRDYRDMLAGGLLVLAGLSYAAYASVHYDLGTLRRMGPGMFPTALGLLLALFGAILFAQSFLRRGTMPEISFRAPFFVLLGIAAFALAIPHLGLLPAVVAVTAISSAAEGKMRTPGVAMLCAALCLIAWAIFSLGLGLTVPLVRWPG